MLPLFGPVLHRQTDRQSVGQELNSRNQFYLAPSSLFFQRKLCPWHFLQRLDGPGFLAPQSRQTL